MSEAPPAAGEHATSWSIRMERPALSQVMVDKAPILIAFVGRDERYQSVNPQYETLFRKPLDEIIGWQIRDVVGAAAYEQLRKYIRRALQGEAVEYSAWLELPSGQKRYWSASYQPLIEGGEVQGFFTYVVDTTGEKLALKAQQDKERIYRDLFENSAVSMAQLDGNWRWLDVNSQLCRELGYARTELLELKLEDIFHAADLAANLPSIEMLLRNETDRYKADMRLVSKQGSISWGRVTLSTVLSWRTAAPDTDHQGHHRTQDS